MSFTTDVLWQESTVLFDGKYDFIFLLTKSVAVGLFHQCQIKLMTLSARKQFIIFVYEHFVYEHFYYLNQQIFNFVFKVPFQLAVVDLNSSALIVRNVCDRHRILKR